jgi:hypothetical protein
MVSITERDAPALGVRHDRGAALLDPLAAAFEEAGLHAGDPRQPTVADVANLGSSWAKRLGIPERRPAWVLTAQERPAGGVTVESGGLC